MSERHFMGWLRRGLRWSVLPAVAVAIFSVYRWAERPADPMLNGTIGKRSRVSVSLENAPFTAYADGRKTWSLRAARIDLERQDTSPLSSVDSATLTGIQQGRLYQLPDAASPLAVVPAKKTKAADAADVPAATFHAQAGRYAQNAAEPLTPDLAPLFTPHWQFRLTGNVVFRTRAGDELRAPSLVILEMTNRRTGHLERRIVCDQGATIEARGVHLQSNQMRYNPADRSIECVTGARAVFREGNVQAERVYWLPNRQLLLCPDAAAGTMRGIPFQATNLTVNVREKTFHANEAMLQLRMDSENDLFAP